MGKQEKNLYLSLRNEHGVEATRGRSRERESRDRDGDRERGRDSDREWDREESERDKVRDRSYRLKDLAKDSGHSVEGIILHKAGIRDYDGSILFVGGGGQVQVPLFDPLDGLLCLGFVEAAMHCALCKANMCFS